MSNISNGAPRFILEGIRDESLLPPVPVPEVYAQHLPHLYILAERGPLTPQLLDPSLLVSYYGASTFDPLSKFYTMGSSFVSTIGGAGNAMMVQRVHPADALTPAYWTIGLELVEDEITDYKRDSVTGIAERDESGNFVLDTTKRTGLRGRIVINQDIGHTKFGEAVKKKGQLTSSTNTQSDYYPIMDLEVPSPGEFGNNVGFSLWAPNSQSVNPLNVAVAVDQIAQLFRLRIYERPDQQSTPVLKLTKDRESEINFSFKKTVVDTATTLKYSFPLRAKDYDRTEDGFIPMPGPLGRTKVYYDSLEEALKLIATNEVAANPDVLHGTDSFHQFNFLSGVDFYNNPYYTLRIEGVADGGANMNDVAIYYAEGGSDGTYEDAAGDPIDKIAMYNKLCKEQFDNYGDLKDIEVLDDARYPQSAYWDCGYDLDTKKSLISIVGKRKDLVVYVGTYIDGHARLTASEQRSMASALRTFARLYPESTLYGTSVCRVVFFMQSGLMAGDDSENYYPHLLDHAYKRAMYAGAGDGVLKNPKAYDAADNNRVQLLRGMDLLWEPNEIRNANWDLGLNYATNVNRSQAYVPHVQTVYSEESSVLRDEISLTICVDIEKKCQQAYRMLGVDTRRTTEQTLAELNRILTDLTKDLYDNRVDITVNTFRTVKDVNSRVRYSCEVNASFNKGMYIGSFTVVSRNREDNA